MDPLSNLIALLKPRNFLSAGLDAGGDWCLQFPDQLTCIKTGAVVSGSGWLCVDGIGEPVRLQAGDCFLLTSGRPFRLASDLSLPATDAVAVFTAPRQGNIALHNGGGDFLLASNRFSIDGHHGEMLLRSLPPVLHVRDRPGQATLRWAVERIMEEMLDPQPGSVLVIDHLAQMMLVQALRLHLDDPTTAGIGWLAGLADRQLSKAITAIHDDPAHRWTLHGLAELAGMSRSSFAEKFRKTVGMPAMEYMGQWRMLLAAERLQNAGEPIAVIAPSLGYESEAAFSTAFKKIMGTSPRHYARTRQPLFATPPAAGSDARDTDRKTAA